MAFERLLLACVSLALLLCSTAAAAGDPPPTVAQKETARGLMQAGDKKFESGDYAGALKAYEGADKIMGVPTTTFAVARAFARLGKLVEAADALGRLKRYRHDGKEPDAYVAAREEASKLEADVLRRIPEVRVNVTGPAPDTPIEIRVDGARVEPAAGLAVRLNPGKHVVTAMAPGYFEGRATVNVVEGAREEISLTLEPDPSWKPPAPPKPPTTPLPHDPDPPKTPPETVISPLTYAAFAVGGAGLIVGIATGAAALAETSSLEDQCGGTTCPESLRGEHDTIEALANASNVAFAFAAVGVGVGVVSLIFDLQPPEPDEEEADVTARVVAGPAFVGVVGSF